MENSQENLQPKRKRIVRKTEVFSFTLERPKIIEIDIPIVNKIGDFAKDFGVKVYAVGGFVRDKLLGRNVKDIDFTVVGNAIDFVEFVGRNIKKNPIIYERFKTALLVSDDYNLEFVGTRKEIYEKHSRKPIVSDGSLEDDIKRRDFTVNAMAVSLNKDNYGELIDLFGGYDDLQKKILRTPLDPGVTFSDDPLRMMRAARFSSQLDFEIEENCLDQLNEMSDRIQIISQERITEEFFKILDSDNPAKGLHILYSSGILKWIFPELDNLAGVDLVEKGEKVFAHKDVFRHSVKVLENIVPMTKNRWLRFAALIHDIAKPKTKRFVEGVGWTFHGHEDLGAKWMNKIFRRMKFPLDDLEYVEKLIRLHQRPMQLVDEEVTDSAIRRLAFQAGDALEDLFTLVRADITTKNPNLTVQYRNNYEKVFQKVIEVQERDKLKEFQSPVRGEEIMEICGIEPSRLVGYIKEQIEEAILDGIIPNEYEPAKEFFINNKNKWIKEYKA